MKETGLYQTIPCPHLVTTSLYLHTLAVVVYRQCYIWLVMVVLYLQVDILHPLATLHWKQCPPLPTSIFDAQRVFVNNRLYVGSGGILSYGTEHINSRIFVFSTNLDLLSELTTPTNLYGLTTYNSQLVLVGGVLSSTNRLSNQLWIRNEEKGIWDPSLLPPMPTARSYSSAINIGSRECIVVAGGRGKTGPVDTVEALIEGQWLKLQPLPEPCWNMTSTLHNGKWYLNTMGEYIFCCNLESLISSSYVGPVWSIIDCNTSYQSIASFGQQLIAIGRSGLVPTIHALSPLTQFWVRVGDMPEELVLSFSIVLPTRELVVIGKRSEIRGSCVFKASLSSEELILQDFLFPRRVMCVSLTKAFSTYPCLSCSSVM